MVQNLGRQDAVSSLSTTEPISSSGDSWLTASHTEPVAAKVSGTVIRLRQFEADHHRLPRTAWSVVWLDRDSPGW